MTRVCDVLVVDDEPVVLDGTGRILRSEKLSVDAADSADAALSKLHDARYRMVLSDLMLPGIDGIGLLQALLREHPDTPLVMITGYATLDRAVECFKEGVFDFLPKPFDTGELLAVVRRALGFLDLDSVDRRSVDLAVLRGLPGSLPKPTALLALGQHAWAALLPNGSARIGVGESFRGLRGGLRAEFPEEQEETLQGNECARIITGDGLAHRLWAPLSGRIIETDPGWTAAHPWLMSIVPTDLENESKNLTTR